MLHITIDELKAAVAEALAQEASPWLDTAGAAAYLGVGAETVKAWRKRGCGPRFRTVNRRLVRYHRDDLDAFVIGGDDRG